MQNIKQASKKILAFIVAFLMAISSFGGFTIAAGDVYNAGQVQADSTTPGAVQVVPPNPIPPVVSPVPPQPDNVEDIVKVATQAALAVSFGLEPNGGGTEENPWIISTADHLLWMNGECDTFSVEQRRRGHYLLMSDIVAPFNFMIGAPIVNNSPELHEVIAREFIGHFNGNNHTITLDVSHSAPVTNREADTFGLFRQLGSGGVVENTHAAGSVIGVTTTSTFNVPSRPFGKIGGLVGYVASGGTVKNSHSSVEVTGSNLVGGLVGANSGRILQSSATGDISIHSVGVSNHTGGLVGLNAGLIRDSFASGSLTNNTNSRLNGGLVGSIFINGAIIQNSYATGDIFFEVSNPSPSGGLVGGVSNSGFVSQGIPDISNNVALNKEIYVTGGIHAFGRIASAPDGANADPNMWEGLLSNNFAYEGMVLGGSAYTGITAHDNRQGESVSMAELQTKAWWANPRPNWTPWDFENIWYWCETELRPALRAAPTISLLSVTFDLNGGNVAGNTANISVDVLPGRPVTPPSPTREGYGFSGWVSSVPGMDTGNITGNVTFTAQWQADQADAWTVTFNLSGGNIVGNTSNVVMPNIPNGSTVTPPTPTRLGHQFLGWESSVGGITFDNITGNVVFTAQWLSLWEVTFNLDGGSIEDSTDNIVLVNVQHGADVTPISPTREGFVFVGWSSSVLGMTPARIIHNVTFTAIWRRDLNLEGDGSQSNPWLIFTVDDLLLVNIPHLDIRSGHFRLMADITAPRNFVIGAPLNMPMHNVTGSAFLGHFDGNGHTITMDIALEHIQPWTVGIGLFRILGAGGVVENLHVAGDVHAFSVTGNMNDSVEGVGALAGRMNRGGVVRNVKSSAHVTGGTMVGGIVGDNSGELINSFSTGTVGSTQPRFTSFDNIGGLVGLNTSFGIIRDSYTTGDVIGHDRVGGIAGANYGTIQNSYFTGNATGVLTSNNIGGIVGLQQPLPPYGTPDASNNVVLSGNIQGGNLAGVGRVSTTQADFAMNLQNNFASEARLINGAQITQATTHDSPHGQTITMAEYRTREWWENPRDNWIPWDFVTTWDWCNTMLRPVLKNNREVGTAPPATSPPAMPPSGEYVSIPAPPPTIINAPTSATQQAQETQLVQGEILTTTQSSDIVNYAIENGETTAHFTLDTHYGLTLLGSTIQAMAQAEMGMTITTEQFTVTISPQQIAAWNFNASDDIVIIATPVDGNDLTHVSSALMALPNISSAMLEIALSNMLEVLMYVNGETTDEGFSFTITVETTGMYLNPTQQMGLRGFIAYQADTTNPDDISIFTTRGIYGNSFSFTTTQVGVFGVLVLEPNTAIRFGIGSTAFINNNVIQTTDTAPFIDQSTNRTMMPLRAISEALGAQVSWEETTRTGIISRNGFVVTVQLDTALPNNMGVPQIINNRTFVPLAYVSQALGAEVRWDESTRAAYVYEWLD